jgi:predicted anti-sigma-YlaC factor YlaD
MAAGRDDLPAAPAPGREEPSARLFPAPGRAVDCGQIQEVLFDYMARELGDAQSLLVHEHLRRCDVCRREAAAMRETLDLLRAGDPGRTAAGRLSECRRRRLRRALLHPVMDWIIVHHWLVALVAALLVLGCLLLLAWFCGRPPAAGTPLWIRRWGEAP